MMMNDYLKGVLDIVKIQAAARKMTGDEIISMVYAVYEGICLYEKCIKVQPIEDVEVALVRGAIKERTITCLECGKYFKFITKKHLASHDLDAASYREKWGINRNTPLVCKSLRRNRRKTMEALKLWEWRKSST